MQSSVSLQYSTLQCSTVSTVRNVPVVDYRLASNGIPDHKHWVPRTATATQQTLAFLLCFQIQWGMEHRLEGEEV